jgi:hypothetical protein
MVGRDGGKAKPLKQPKKPEKVVLDEDINYKKKMVCSSEISPTYFTRLMKGGRLLPQRRPCKRSSY